MKRPDDIITRLKFSAAFLDFKDSDEICDYIDHLESKSNWISADKVEKIDQVYWCNTKEYNEPLLLLYSNINTDGEEYWIWSRVYDIPYLKDGIWTCDHAEWDEQYTVIEFNLLPSIPNQK